MKKTQTKSDLAVETKNLTKKFGDFVAVKDVNLKIKKGEAYALIGPNGAGKTTLLKMIVGLYSSTSGSAYILGHDIVKESVLAKKLFGYISDSPSAYEYLTGLEFLSLTGNLRGLAKDKIERRTKEISKAFPLAETLDQPMSSYSRGNKQKVAFLASILAEPPILFIDEPIAGLDPKSIGIFGKKIRDYVKKGNTVMFISHSLSFAKDYADRVGLMESGEIVREEIISEKFSIESFAKIS